MHTKRNRRGFTLIELLIVIGIIGFLAAAVLVAVDPVKRIQDSRDARRYSEANGLLNALLTKQVDDRRIYNGSNDAPVITSATNAQVIVTSTTGIECDAVSTGATESYPGCGKALDTTARVSTGTLGSVAGVTVTGSGTNFLTAFRVGDVLREAAVSDQTGGSCTVLSIASDTSLDCVAAPSPAWTNGATLRAVSKKCVANLTDVFAGVGTADATASTTVTGTNTNFTAQVSVGDILTSSNGNTCTVTAVASATSLTCSAAVTFTGTYTITLKNALTPNYIASLPIDPRGTGESVCTTGCTTNAVGITTIGSTNTGYYVQRTTGNRVEIGACAGEQTTAISVKR